MHPSTSYRYCGAKDGFTMMELLMQNPLTSCQTIITGIPKKDSDIESKTKAYFPSR